MKYMKYPHLLSLPPHRVSATIAAVVFGAARANHPQWLQSARLPARLCSGWLKKFGSRKVSEKTLNLWQGLPSGYVKIAIENGHL